MNQKINPAKGNTSKIVRVRMIANMMEPDKEGQTIAREAFDKATVDRFLKEGIIEWFHKTITGKTMEEKCGAVLGRPVSFAWENGLPVVYADLTKAHPMVRDHILPHLEAGNDVFGASVGGDVLRVQKAAGGSIDSIRGMVWRTLSVAPIAYVLSGGSAVTLAKASEGNRLEGPARDVFEKIIRAIVNGEVEPSADAVKKYLRGQGMGTAEVNSMFREYKNLIRRGK